ncbi:LGFP repeat-containing protein [Nocardia farcinica]|uniref:LGFP repeat-containing protein n=1 Tax=Nocardia farcinica TaxID=37329 RepID=UPI00245770E1|nr:hypothetical protein [Nocardia farcinica]
MTTHPQAPSTSVTPPLAGAGHCSTAPSGRKAKPDKWEPTKNPKKTVVPGEMRSDCEEIPEGFTKEQADKAETMEAALADNTSARAALVTPGCQVYWPAPYEVCGAIRDKYNSLGGPNSFLLWPTSNELTNPDGIGKRSAFQNGPIYWSPWGGAHPVVNHFFAAWQRNGWEAGVLGYPRSDELVNGDNLGRRQEFDGGTIYWMINEAYYVTGAIRDRWSQLGSEMGSLGYPVTDEVVLPDGVGRMNRFQNGMIYWHPTYGAWEIPRAIEMIWGAAGYETSSWGYPMGAPYPDGQYVRQPFAGGVISYSAVTEAKETVQGCTFNQEWPHNSHHFPGTVDGVLSAVCDSDRLKIEAKATMTFAPKCSGFGCGSVLYIEKFAYSKGQGTVANVRSLISRPDRDGRPPFMECRVGDYQISTEFKVTNADGSTFKNVQNSKEVTISQCPETE